MHAAAAALGAQAPCAPWVHIAVDGARVRVARAVLGNARAASPTVLCRLKTSTRAALRSAATGLAARGPEAPRCHSAVNRAGRGTAYPILLGRAAALAAEECSDRRDAVAFLEGTTASVRAGAPRAPFRLDTIHRAHHSGTLLRLRQERARVATVRHSADDTTGARPLATSAGLGTRAPGGERCERAVPRALAERARARLLRRQRAHSAPVGGQDCDLTEALRHANSA